MHLGTFPKALAGMRLFWSQSSASHGFNHVMDKLQRNAPTAPRHLYVAAYPACLRESDLPDMLCRSWPRKPSQIACNKTHKLLLSLQNTSRFTSWRHDHRQPSRKNQILPLCNFSSQRPIGNRRCYFIFALPPTSLLFAVWYNGHFSLQYSSQPSANLSFLRQKS